VDHYGSLLVISEQFLSSLKEVLDFRFVGIEGEQRGLQAVIRERVEVGKLVFVSRCERGSF
jgi:hypothetical protein